MTQYGNTNRISVDVLGGGIAGININTEEKAVVFANGDPNAGSVSINSPTRVSGPGQLEGTFGSDQDINDQMRLVAANGISYDNMWGVVPEQVNVSNEDITGGGDAEDHTGGSEISEAPIVEDTSLITVQDDQGSTLSVEFRYETNKDATNTDFTSLSPSTDTMFINPNTGEWVADASDNYNIAYDHLDWQSAFDSAVGVVSEQETGTWFVNSEADEVITSASSTASPLRTNDWKMIKVLGPAEPNDTSSDNDGIIAAGDYQNGVDADATYLTGPARLEDSKRNAGGAVAGRIAGNPIDDPIIGDSLQGVTNLEQEMSVSDQETLEGEGVIPLSNLGPKIEGNVGTSSATDWTRTVFSRKLADRLILAARAVAKAVRGKLNNVTTQNVVEQQLSDEIVDLVEDGVLEPNTEQEQKWYVSATEDSNNKRELDVSFGFTPTGVVDVVEIEQTINY